MAKTSFRFMRRQRNLLFREFHHAESNTMVLTVTLEMISTAVSFEGSGGNDGPPDAFGELSEDVFTAPLTGVVLYFSFSRFPTRTVAAQLKYREIVTV